MPDNDWTSLSCRQPTRKRLHHLCIDMDIEYDELLNRLIDFWERYKGVVKEEKP